MSLREWLIIIGALVILGVLLDGVRRMYRARQDAHEFSQGMGSSDIAHTPLDEEFNPELPNGGSRVVRPGRDTAQHEARTVSASRATPARPAQPQPSAQPPSSEVEEAQPVSRPEVAAHQRAAVQQEAPPVAKPETVAFQEPVVPDEPDVMDVTDTVVEETESFVEADHYYTSPRQEGFGVSEDERPHTETTQASPVEEFAQGAKALWHKLRNGQLSGDKSREEVHKEREQPDPEPVQPASLADEPDDDLGGRAPKAGANRPPAEEVVVINVHCKGDQRLPGGALKQLFEGCGMEYGDMNIYHRHEEPDTRSPVQFSVANAVSPGTFRPEEMPAMKTSGISFFMSLPGPEDPLQAFEFMLETAQTVVRNLGGELKDEQRSVMTGQTIEHCRQRIREFERRRHFAR